MLEKIFFKSFTITIAFKTVYQWWSLSDVQEDAAT
jgi:hypothetical protein